MLNSYLTSLQNLIQAPTSLTPLISTASATSYINTARNQVAADAECIRTEGVLTLSNAQQSYLFSSIVVPTAAGFGSVMTVRSASIGGRNIDVESWEWFQAYYRQSPPSGSPTLMAQLGQGSGGVLFFWPIPNSAIQVILDCACLPVPLANDSTTEQVPDLWRDAVPFYAAFLAMQSLQRQADAQAMLSRYMLLARRGRQFATPSELPDNMPGGMGTQIAGAHTTLGQPAQSTGR